MASLMVFPLDPRIKKMGLDTIVLVTFWWFSVIQLLMGMAL